MGSFIVGARRLGAQLKTFLGENRPALFPIRRAFRDYKKGDAGADVRAGINVALLAFPQGLAYAVIAGLPIVYGVTCSAIAAVIAPLFAGSRFTILGPTNATAFMVFSYFATYPELFDLRWMPMIVLTVGLLLIIGSILKMADLIQYISRSVVVGYITGAAVLIIANQLKHLLGVSLPTAAEGGAPRTFFSVLWETLRRVGEADLVAVGISGLSVLLFFGLTKVFKKLPVFAITLLLVSIVSYFLQRNGFEVATYASQAFGPNDLMPDHSGWSAAGFFSRWGQFFGLSVAIAFLAAMENSVMAQTLGSQTGQRPDRNQDMFGVGVSNLACAIFSGMPASGSLTRSALNFASGAASRLSSIIAGVLCLIGALTLGDLVRYIPKAALAMLVVCIAVSLINVKQIRIALNATPGDALTIIATFLATLVMPLHVAIFLGVGVSVALYLRLASRPHLVEYQFNDAGQLTEASDGTSRANPAISIVHVEGELFFGAAELFRTQIQRTCHDANLRIIVLRMKNAHHLDATSVMALEELVGYLRKDGRDLIVSGAMKEVYRVLKNSGMVEVIGRENIFLGSPSNPTLATRNALLRAQEILGTKKADVRIYYDPGKQPE